MVSSRDVVRLEGCRRQQSKELGSPLQHLFKIHSRSITSDGHAHHPCATLCYARNNTGDLLYKNGRCAKRTRNRLVLTYKSDSS